ncbi:MAG: peptidase C11 [Oscillospiraceae bacterium]|nr:peptidase C11 [Oscillospiraceae bacterium]
MDKTNRPQGREKHVTGGSADVHRRGDGLNSGGPVGNPDGYSGRRPQSDIHGSNKDIDIPGGGSQNRGAPTLGSMLISGLIGAVIGKLSAGPSQNNSNNRRSGCGCGCLIIIVVGLLLLFFGGILFSDILTMSGTGISSSHPLYGGYSSGSGNYYDYSSSPWDGGNTGILDYSVAEGSRAKRTVIQGGGKDTVTIMVYMCGTDLESNGGMATADLQEMAAASIGSNVNLIVYTGGCRAWKNNIVSSKVNQIYQIKDGKLTCLMQNAGSDSMTKPHTLTEFIRWCTKNFPANRNELIFWDHGGGSISGYGYDEKYPNSGSMTLAGINQALFGAGVKFDFIGFDACLMATLENALMLSQYADYMIASEETEPGVGWYYTDWLTALSNNTSMPTIEIGKQITDDFVSVCARTCRGQQTTLSVVDLAELETTVPDALMVFSRSTSKMITGNDYKTVSNARSKTREFAQANSIDQVDLINLADNINTSESKKLSKVLGGAVKYNLTSSNMTHAYGLSIYFPYKRVSKVDSIINTYKQIGMDEEYTRCIREFAGVEVSGQAASGGTGSPLGSLLGYPGASSGSISADMISDILGSLVGGNYGGISGLTGSNTDFLSSILSGGSLDKTASYIEKNRLDESNIFWDENDDGMPVLKLSEKEWDLIQELELNMFYDDGEGFVDLGLDNVYEFDDDGNLIGETDNTWLAINGQPVAYYFLSYIDDGEGYTILGRVPAMLNNTRVDLILSFDSEHPYGRILGARTDYDETETETVARGLTELNTGDKLDFLCDYYSYDGDFQDSYYLGETMTVTDNMTISNVAVGGRVQATYRITDIYNKQYWTPPMP